MAPMTKRLYRYEWGGEVLPFDVGLGQRSYPFLQDTREQVSYRDKDNYVFVSQAEGGGAVVVRKEMEEVVMINGLESEQKITDFEYRSDLGRVIFQTTNQFGEGDTRFFAIEGNNATLIREEATLQSPVIIDVDTFLGLQNGEVYEISTATGRRTRLAMSSLATYVEGERTRSMRFFPELRQLVIVDVVVDPDRLVPESKVYLYSLATESDVVTPELLYSVTFIDTVVSDLVMSPAGRYMALLATETLQRRDPAVLLFDIMNGIIKEENGLSVFDPVKTTLDGWTLF
jgi:hypothetical protein